MNPLLVLIALLGTANAVVPGQDSSPRDPDAVPEGLAKLDWSSIRAAYEAGRHAFLAVEGGFQARNPGQQWFTRFDGRGFTARPDSGGWEWGLELESYGFPGQECRHSRPAVVSADGQRLTCAWDGCLEEWLINDQRGLEHGFTVKERPPLDCGSLLPLSVSQPAAGQPGEAFPASQAHPRQQAAPTPKRQQAAAVQELCFTLGVRGGLRPEIAADAQAVDFLNEAGATVLTYSGLKVWDADGKTLPSHFEAASNHSLRLVVDERGARYPITIDPIAQQAYLKPAAVGTYQERDEFGYSVAVSGDTVVVGARYENSSTTGVNSEPNESALGSGAAYVFVRSGTTWTQQAYLKPAAVGTSQDRFGSSVAISGDTVVVGVPAEDSSTTGVNSTPNESTFAAGSSGAAYVFLRSGTTWTQQAYLKPAAVGTTQKEDLFGSSVAVSGDTVVVGAYGEDSSTTGVNSVPNESARFAGAAYVFVRSGTTWTQQAYLKPAAIGSTQEGDAFGFSVAVSGDTVVVGAREEDSSTTGVNTTPDESAPGAGSAYVFTRNGTTWTQEAYLKPAAVGTMQDYDHFGWSVAVSGNTVVVGAYEADSSTTGVNSEPNESAPGSGAAYIFVRNGTTWTQQAYLKPATVGNSQARDQFGWSVAVSGNNVVVGAPFEDSNTTGMNSTPNDIGRNLFDSGAAYIYLRSGTIWTQLAYLKPAAVGATQAGDNFGHSVALSGDTVIVGAPFEDSSTTGINNTPNEAASAAGAAYVFNGFDTRLRRWRQQHFSTSENTGNAANDADAEGDGWANLVEYGVVTNPNTRRAEGLELDLHTFADGEHLRSLFFRDPARNDVTIRVEAAGDLAGPWTTVASSVHGAATTGPGLVSETNLPGGLKQVEVRDTVPTTATRRFLRITVQE